MSETKNPGEKKLSVSGKTLTLKPRSETGTVRQSFSHGRSKQVVVEKVKRRAVGGETKAEAPPAAEPKKPAGKAAAASAAGRAAVQAETAPKPKPSGVVLRTLTEEERSARAHALADSRVREAEERKIAEEEARRRASREASHRTEREAAEARKRDEEERRKHDEETKRKAGEVAKKRFGVDEAPRSGPGARLTLEADEDEAPRSRRGAGRPATAPRAAPRVGTEKQRGRLTVINALSAGEVRERSVASFRRRTQRLKGVTSAEPKEKLVREVTIPEAITIQDLANRMSERAVDVIRLLMKQGQMATINDVIDADTAQLIAEEMGIPCAVWLKPTSRKVFLMWPTTRRNSHRALPLSQSWAMSITEKRPCWTRFARRKLLPAKPVASRSISAPIRSPRRREPRLPSSTRRATRLLRRCERVALKSRTSSCWLSPLTTE